jgi:uncharacterized protein
MEKRCFEAQLEVRQGESGAATLAGYAAVFGEWSEDLGGFRERIAPGAFQSTLSGDVRALWNHDPAFVLGRTTNGTLRLHEDDRGLKIEIDPPSGALFSSFLENVRRGDVSQMSFGFSVVEDEKSFDENGKRLRTLKSVRLHEVSPVTFPAYPQTEVSLRDWEPGAGTGIGEQGTGATDDYGAGEASVNDDAADVEIGGATSVGVEAQAAAEGEETIESRELTDGDQMSQERSVQRQRRLRLAAV